MKRIFTILIIAISIIVAGNAQSPRKQTANKPVNVIKQLNYVIDTYCQNREMSSSIIRNPNTNLIETSEKIAHFSFKKSKLNQQLNLIREAFTKDKSVGYQFKHIGPGIEDLFSLDILSGNGTTNRTHLIRKNSLEEMWFMCCKNAENPQLRDAYAISWTEPKNEGVIEGYIYIITSLRPDIFTKKMDSSKIFKLDGHTGNDIHDSIYVFYTADTYEELNRLHYSTHSFEELKKLVKTDPVFKSKVSFLPIVNNRFEYIAEIDNRMIGRQRAVLPDGSLYKDWMDIDMVPGETYHLTIHNGYVKTDDYYEAKFGTLSGKSLIPRFANKTFKLDGRMGYDLNDSIYVFYMADTYEELNEMHNKTNSYEELKKIVDTDPQYEGKVAFLPIRNNKFEYSIELDNRKIGRQRAVLPDGSLCNLWMDIDMVPGETYNLTVHDGFVKIDDYYEKNHGRYSGRSLLPEYATQNFRLDGTMGEDLNDSIYAFYMADTYEELTRMHNRTASYKELRNLVNTDPLFKDKVVFLPIVNNKFEYSKKIDKRMIGRQRAVLPDGSLCDLWMDIDMVPGHTYRLFVHNGSVTPDYEYERYYGRHSGNSLIPGYNNIRNSENAAIINEDTDFTQQRDISNKIQSAKESQNLILKNYIIIDEQLKLNVQSGKETLTNADLYFNTAYKLNKQLDKQLNDIVEAVKESNLPNKTKVDVYKEILALYARQNSDLNILFADNGNFSKAGIKCQKFVNKVTEKYYNKLTPMITQQTTKN